jgi:gas vesicle protein
MDKDDYLALLGLQTKRSVAGELLGMLGMLGVGLVVGAGAALLLAPKPGKELWHDIRSKIMRSNGVSTSGESVTTGLGA